MLSDTATTGFVERLRSSVIQLLAKKRKPLKGLNISTLSIGGGLKWGYSSNCGANVLAAQCTEGPTGL